MNTYKALVKHLKNQATAAQLLDVKQGTVSGWVRGVHGMSAETALKAQVVTNGAFKASDLCPRLKDIAIEHHQVA